MGGPRIDDGLTPQQRWYRRNREKARGGILRWTAANKEHAQAVNHRWHQEHAEQHNANSRKWYAEHREQAKANFDRWNAEHPEAHHEHHARANAKRRGAPVLEKVVPQVVFERDNWTCQLCGGAIDKALKSPHPMSVSLDHVVPLARGGVHSRLNTQAAHRSCNSRKGAR